MRRHGDRSVGIVDGLRALESGSRHHIERIVGLQASPATDFALQRGPDILIQRAVLGHHVGAVVSHPVRLVIVVTRSLRKHVPAVVTPCTVTAAVAACPDVLLVAGGNHGQLVIGIVIEIVDPAQNGRFIDLLEDRISHPMRNMPVDIVAYRIVAQFSARKELIAHKRRIIGLIDISVVGTIFGLLAPRTVVVDEARGPLRQRQGGGITVGIGYVDPRRAVVVGIVFVQIEVGRVPDVSAGGGYLLIQIERTPLRIPALRDDRRLEGDARRALGRNLVRCG